MDGLFARELERFGPAAFNGGGAPLDLAASRRYCRRLARRHYENFTVASWLLPRRLHQHFYNVYAYCRWADDLADEVPDRRRALELLEWWRERVHEMYAGRPRHPVMVALAGTVRECNIPAEPLLDLLVAFEQDQAVRDYETYEELLGYCRYSANPVGRLVLYVGRAFDEPRAALSDCICTGLQLANFWQDVARDYDAGRVYLPREDRVRFGYSDDMLAARACTPEFRRLLEFEVERAREWLERGLPLAGLVPRHLRIDVELFARGGLMILDRIAAQGYDVWSQRPVVSRRAQLRLLARAAVGSVTGIGRHACVDRGSPASVRSRASFGSRASLPCLAGARSAADRRRATWRVPPCRSASGPSSLAASYALCGRIARREANNFYYAFYGLPAERRRAMCALYAFLRLSDDIADSDRPVEARQAELIAWRLSVARALEGVYEHAIFPALHDVVRRYRVPAACLFELLDGAALDQQQTSYETFADLARYCYRVASTVGLACIHIWGYRGGPRALKLAEQCGIALQLTNILRDVKEDAARGRIYLPREELARFGYTAEDLRRGCVDDRFRRLMEFEVDRARSYYRRGEELVRWLDPVGRPVFRAMLRLYEAILDKIERNGYDVFRRRIRLSPPRKCWIAARAVAEQCGAYRRGALSRE